MTYNFKKHLTTFLFAVVLLLPFNSRTSGQDIYTVAGNGIQSYYGDGGLATAAELNTAGDLATDDSGNVYIADAYNYRIRKITVATGIINTIAGNGNAGYMGDGGQATNAEINVPYGLAIDDSGNVYFADGSNNEIRKITISTGIINTVAGDYALGAGYNGDNIAATAAQLYQPTGVALDDSGNIFIGDFRNQRIREVRKTTGIITTVAGNGTPGFIDNVKATLGEIYYPGGIAIDDSNNIYIADAQNNRIRKVTAKTGIISTVAGNGTGAYTGDNGPAVDATMRWSVRVGLDDSGNVYIGDQYNDVIRKVTKATGIITTFAGNGIGQGTQYGGFSGDGGPATAAELSGPTGVAADNCGNVYIADYNNYRIREVVSSGTYSISIKPVSPICNGGSDTLKVSEGGVYTWAPSTGLSATTGSVVIANPTISTTYTVTSGNSVCTATATVTVAVDSAPALTTKASLSGVCDGQSVTLSVTNTGTNFIWSPSTGLTSTTGDSVVASPAISTKYTVMGLDSVGCQSTGTDSITVIPAPPFNILPLDTAFCSGQSAILYVDSGGSNFVWTPINGITDSTLSGGDSIAISTTATTTYTVTGINPAGCATSGTDVVTIIPSPGTPTFSQVGDTLISSSVHDNQWYRNDSLLMNDTSQYLITNIKGEYYVVVTNEVNGCSTASDSTYTDIQQVASISNQLSIYPNPFSNDIFIKINSSAKDVKDWSLQITDVLGRTLYSTPSLNYSNDIGLSDFSNGVYFIIVVNKTGKAVLPVVKQN